MENEYRKTFPYAPLGYLVVTLIYFGLMIFSAEVTVTKVTATGLILTILAYIPWIVARRELGNSLTINKPEARKLVTTGIYSKIQHPLYLSQTLVILGVCLFVGNFYLTVFATLGYLLLSLYRSREEHKILRSAFGDEYQAYADKTWF